MFGNSLPPAGPARLAEVYEGGSLPKPLKVGACRRACQSAKNLLYLRCYWKVENDEMTGTGSNG